MQNFNKWRIDVLEQLDSIDWKSYNAEYIPDLTRGLASPEVEIQLDAELKLWWILAPMPHGVWEELDAAAVQKLLETELPIVVIPFLMELLQTEEAVRKDMVLQLVVFMSRYREYVEDEAHWELAMRCFEALKIGMPIYQRLLNDANPHVKALALEVIHNLQIE